MRVKRVLIMCVLLTAAIAVSAQVEKREIKVEKGHTYLNLPVKNDNALVRSRVKLKDQVIDEFTIKLAEQDPDFWVFVDVSAYQGKTITLEIEKFAGRPGVPVQPDAKPLPVKGLQLANTATTFTGQQELYKEALRPQAHFSARRGWINDPNGLIYYNGEYHLFFQHNPYGWDWGNMHWGHAVSKDLLHWTELKEAIFPVNNKDAAFSGSAVIDPQNTSGFRKDGIDPLIAFYTSTGRGESIQLSYDNGRTFQDYAGNPLIKHTGRDPKVFWYDKGKHWVMVVWNSGEKKKLSLGEEAIINQHHIYTSNDLKTWTLTSGVAGFFECPELFELPVENQPGQSRWIMYDATGRYIVGDFDGKKFTTQQPLTQYDYAGGYFYASQTFNNTPDNRRIQIGWGRNIKHPGMPFNQAMLFPVELKLKHTPTGYRLCPTPIKEINSLHANSQEVVNQVLKTETPIQTKVSGDALHVKAVFEKGDATFGLNVLGYEIVYNDLLGEFTTALNPKHNTTPAGPQAIFSGPAIPPITTTIYYSDPEKFTLEVIVDKNIIEIFVNDGGLYFAAPYDGAKTNIVEAFVKGRGNRKSILQKLDVHELKSIWPASPQTVGSNGKK
jgi:fructan beta-fructosidase